MAIDRPLDQDVPYQPMSQDIPMEPMAEEAPIMEEEPVEELSVDTNLAEYLTEEELSTVSNYCYEWYRNNRETRSEWEDMYIKGLDLLGLKVSERTEPWDGACGVYHPILAEAVIRFQSHAITSLCPASGPARTKIVGMENEDVLARARRVQEELNYIITEDMSEYRPEMEQLLFYLPLAGSAFTKTWYDEFHQRPVTRFIPAENMVVPYGASDLATTDFCHIVPMTKNQLLKMQHSGHYLDLSLIHI